MVFKLSFVTTHASSANPEKWKIEDPTSEGPVPLLGAWPPRAELPQAQAAQAELTCGSTGSSGRSKGSPETAFHGSAGPHHPSFVIATATFVTEPLSPYM